MPLLSVVVPTLNRPDTLRHALATLLAQTTDDCEFIVQNNGGNAETHALLSRIGDPRLKCFDTPDIAIMSDNWELALCHTQGDYITFLGDDDGLMPDACTIAAAMLGDGDFDLLSWAPYTYYWPGYHHAGFRNRLDATVDFRFTGELVGSHHELGQFYRFQKHYSRLPMIYNSFVSRKIIERVKAKAGRYFLGLSPDVASGIANAALSDNFLRLSRPLSICGISHHSTGHTMFFAETDMLGSTRGSRDFGAIMTDRLLPDLNALPLFLAHDMLAIQRLLFPNDAEISLNFKGLAQAVATGINDRPALYDRSLQSIHELAALHRFDPAEILVPARREERAPLETGMWVRGPHQVQFNVDGEALGLRSIADAVRVMAQFVPGQGALEPASIASGQDPMLNGDGLAFTTRGNGAGALLDGWGESEEWGTWSVATICRVRVRLDPVPIWPLVIELTCRAFVSLLNPHVQISCRVGDLPAEIWHFSPTTPSGCRSLMVDPAKIPPDGRVVITFTVSTPQSPADLGIGTDIRPLGIGIERMWVAG